MTKRPLTITVINQNTGVSLNFDNVVDKHGRPIEIKSGPNPLPSGVGKAVLYTQEKSGAKIGPEGSFRYTFQNDPNMAFYFTYNHPYGPSETSVDVIPPPGYSSTMTDNHLAHHDASCTVNLLKLAAVS